jgi:hypothetical protein
MLFATHNPVNIASVRKVHEARTKGGRSFADWGKLSAPLAYGAARLRRPVRTLDAAREAHDDAADRMRRGRRGDGGAIGSTKPLCNGNASRIAQASIAFDGLVGNKVNGTCAIPDFLSVPTGFTTQRTGRDFLFSFRSFLLAQRSEAKRRPLVARL